MATPIIWEVIGGTETTTSKSPVVNTLKKKFEEITGMTFAAGGATYAVPGSKGKKIYGLHIWAKALRNVTQHDDEVIPFQPEE
tara:strand:- start:12165 stop:12413 length:249 start_codon:yes stop_codon:yes gene_type:complete